jgi:hypothetical protein
MKKTDSKNDKDVQQNPSSKETVVDTPWYQENPTCKGEMLQPASNEIGEGGFDLKELRLTQNFSEEIEVKKIILRVLIRKPNSQDYVRVRPGEEWRIQTVVLKLKDEGEFYFVKRELWPELSLETVPMMLLTTINRQGVLTLWPIRLPAADGRLDTWNRSAFDAAEKAQTGWIRVVSNRSSSSYEAFEAQGGLSEPEWPDISFNEIIRLALKDKLIDRLDHPIVERLRGLK